MRLIPDSPRWLGWFSLLAILITGCGSSAAVPAASSPPSSQTVRQSGVPSSSTSSQSSAASQSQPPAKSSGSTGGTPVSVSYNSAAATDLPYYAAEQQGFFREQNLNVTLVSMSPPVAIAALSKGEISFMNSPSNSIEGVTKGLPFKIVYDSWHGSAWSLIGKPEIGSTQQLKGKTVATNNPGTAPYAFVRAGLKKSGLSVSDVQYVPISGTSNVFAALIAHKIDAGLLSPPYDAQAQEQGLHEIAFLGDELLIPANGLATTTSYVAQHRPVVVAMIRALVKAEQWIKANPDATAALIAKHLGTSMPVAKKTYDRMLPLLTPNGETPPEGIQQDLDLLAETTQSKINMDLQQFVDFGPLHEAEGGQAK